MLNAEVATLNGVADMPHKNLELKTGRFSFSKIVVCFILFSIELPCIAASVNVGREPSYDEVMTQCEASESGLKARLPESFAALEKFYNDIAIRLSSASDREALDRLRYSECVWIRNVAERCLEPTSYTGENVSKFERLTKNIPVGKVYEDDENGCMKELADQRVSTLQNNRNKFETLGRKEIERLVPPPSIYGVYRGAPRKECVMGDPQVLAKDSHFSDWLDCSQQGNEIHISPSLRDSISGIRVWVGVPAQHGTDHVFAGETSYSGELAMTAAAVDDVDLCPMNIQIGKGTIKAAFVKENKDCKTGNKGDVPFDNRETYGLMAAEPEPILDWRKTGYKQSRFEYGSQHGEVLLIGDGVVVLYRDGSRNISTQVSSICNGLPPYQELVAFFSRFQEAIISRDVAALKGMIDYPLQIDPASTKWVGNETQLVKRFDEIFPARLSKAISELDTHFVYCVDHHVMVLGGRLWAKKDSHGTLQIYFVDSDAQPTK